MLLHRYKVDEIIRKNVFPRQALVYQTYRRVIIDGLRKDENALADSQSFVTGRSTRDTEA